MSVVLPHWNGSVTQGDLPRHLNPLGQQCRPDLVGLRGNCGRVLSTRPAHHAFLLEAWVDSLMGGVGVVA